MAFDFTSGQVLAPESKFLAQPRKCPQLRPLAQPHLACQLVDARGRQFPPREALRQQGPLRKGTHAHRVLERRSGAVHVRRLAVLTSPTGAAVRDVLSVLQRRFPLLEVDVLPVQVQGETAAAQIVDMLQRAARSGRYDVLLVAATEKGVCCLAFGEGEAELQARFPKAQLVPAGEEFRELFAAVVAAVEQPGPGSAAIPLDVKGTAFQQRVWEELRRIPHGETRSYGQQAEAIGKPAAVRAVPAGARSMRAVRVAGCLAWAKCNR